MRVWSGNGSSEDAGGGGGGAGDALGVEERAGEKEVLGFDISRLEAYSERAPSEVLRVHAMVDDEEDQVIIFKVLLSGSLALWLNSHFLHARKHTVEFCPNPSSDLVHQKQKQQTLSFNPHFKMWCINPNFVLRNESADPRL